MLGRGGPWPVVRAVVRGREGDDGAAGGGPAQHRHPTPHRPVGHTTPVHRFAYLAVAGPSMEPTLHDGDWIIARRDGRAGVGDVVVVEHPGRPGMLIVKRVQRAGAEGYWVVGDAPELHRLPPVRRRPGGRGQSHLAGPPLGPDPLTPPTTRPAPPPRPLPPSRPAPSRHPADQTAFEWLALGVIRISNQEWSEIRALGSRGGGSVSTDPSGRGRSALLVPRSRHGWTGDYIRGSELIGCERPDVATGQAGVFTRGAGADSGVGPSSRQRRLLRDWAVG